MAVEPDRSTASDDLKVQFDEQGLVPAIVQDWRDGAILMFGYMNRASLDQTLQTGYVHFWSRSRRKLWKKGETSGHYLLCKRVFLDCDGDVLLVKAEPTGPTCHTEAHTCFFTEVTSQGVTTTQVGEEANGGIFDRLYEMVLQRKSRPQAHSYVSDLMKDGPDRILKKVVEEAGEVVLAVKKEHREEIIHEVADLLFHAVVALGHCEIPMKAIQQELGKRFGQSGIRRTVPEQSR